MLADKNLSINGQAKNNPFTHHEVLLDWSPRIHAWNCRDSFQQTNWYGLNAVVHQTLYFALKREIELIS